MSLNSQAIWSSPFRPFFLLGAIYGPVLILSLILSYTTLVPESWSVPTGFPALWHQHEIVFGFSTAIIFGFILTALPSWFGIAEVRGPTLMLLVLSWILGRLGAALSGLLPLPLVAALDLSFPLLFALLMGRDWLRLPCFVALGLALITAGFALGNLAYYLGLLNQELSLWQQGIRLGLYAMIFHCSVTVGILAPIFTETALQENSSALQVRRYVWLEWLSALLLLGLALLDMASAPVVLTGVVALASCLVHAARMSLWRSLSVKGIPIVWVLHLGYAWLVLALALRAMHDLGFNVDTQSWVHAFTVGGFGLMSVGFMTRVALRHTGRALTPHPMIILAYLGLAVAALLRVIAPALGSQVLVLSALLWVLAYVVYLQHYARILLTPSLPGASDISQAL